ncbi:ABC transporter substrate-binding protein [Desulfosarcina ovata]|uniref:Iron ABC transporter substrate-binding protein n=1 Tax=Desulfosarcina ovata subsp. ovata TaxID=2752305 RepID=A0A5K8ABZ1_9BACT|nr:ABC transporter substrate-binding protein [Desulfosarcina ovata]BBO89544.1 iron ABC transporter substrate-binding protein [Desulfosarcina ovata subsp. ovata]
MRINGRMIVLLVILIATPICSHAADSKPSQTNLCSIVDSRGVRVTLPPRIDRVVTISDGFIEGVMTVFGVQKRLVGVGSSCLTQKDYRFSFPLEGEQTRDYAQGMHTVTLLNPWIADLPLIAVWNSAPNYEKIASLNPDLAIIRVGSCWHWRDDDQVAKSIRMIESLGIPVVVLKSPNTYDAPDLATLYNEIEILGQLFDREEKASTLVRYLRAQVDTVSRRTGSIPEARRTRVLLLGLSPKSREAGGAGMAVGRGTTDTFLLEHIVRGVNAFQESGNFKVLGTEQILALAPDAILLPTAWGYHPPQELVEAPYYADLRQMTAVKNHRVAALSFTPCNCDKRLKYPIDIMVMAKTAYPDRFFDIDLADWLIDFYRNVYGVNEQTAEKLRAVQWMDWTYR